MSGHPGRPESGGAAPQARPPRGLERIAAIVRRIIGAPDYAAYVAHVRSCHPGREPLSESAFVADRLRARYEQPGSRCC